jgi:hypothetical protein
MPNRLLTRLALASTAAIAAVGGFIVARRTAARTSTSRTRHIVMDAAEAGMPLQQLTRYRTADRSHSIHAALLAEFAAGERTATLHVAFCPPFEKLPSVEAEAVDDEDADVKVAQLLHNGVQIEVRLSEPAEEARHLIVEVLATDAEA